jgi:hypothetical protein
MASFVAVRRRPAGTEVVSEHNAREFTLWRAGWIAPPDPTPADKDEFVTWATPHVVAMLADEAAEAAEDSADLATIELAAFKAWVFANRTVPEVRGHLKALARMYREAVV